MNAALAQIEADMTDRRDTARLTAMLPVLDFDGAKIRLLDFSDGGFRADMPKGYHTPGAKGTAQLIAEACGYSVTRTIAFEVMHVREGSVGARFDVVRTETTASGVPI